MAYLGQYIRAMIETNGKDPKASDIPADVITALQFVDEFCEYSQVHRKVAMIHIPPYLFDEYKNHAT